MKKLKMICITICIQLIVNVIPFFVFAQSAEKSKINQTIVVLADFKKMKEQIPHELFNQSEGIIIIPKMINAGLGIGGKRGKGIALAKLANGSWSSPSFITITGGSLGLQAGVQSVDLILFVRHRSNLTKMESSFTIGGDLSATAGPIGRSASANTDYKLESEIYSYSRSRGVFAGITVNGVSLSVDQKANSLFYGAAITPKDLWKDAGHQSPPLPELRRTLAGM